MSSEKAGWPRKTVLENNYLLFLITREPGEIKRNRQGLDWKWTRRGIASMADKLWNSAVVDIESLPGFRKVIEHRGNNTDSIQHSNWLWLRKAFCCKFMDDEKVNKGTLTVFQPCRNVFLVGIPAVGHSRIQYCNRWIFLPVPSELFLGYTDNEWAQLGMSWTRTVHKLSRKQSKVAIRTPKTGLWQW